MNDGGTTEGRLARLQEAVAHSLELLEAGRVGEAREELARQLPVAVEERNDSITDHEIEVAFASAEAERERMVDADSVARVAIEQADRELSNADALAPLEEPPEVEDPAPMSDRFATATMADLLEQQGDLDGADRIRSGLDPSAPTADRQAPRRGRRNAVATLERWLENLRGGVRA
ncbi:MAG: hypothetical protein QF890_06645 [Myxococcota bacterium]|nr:hypothetical protein [Deltaproteobacteria bacterium]MDP6074743.1 hypothetical protein [Myxococcota bacterium]MDP6244598.1 hypothetical protein [Myxococcota bacterium]MDP7073173.1 hypothetical protein [Myxococcota bacterium]MDP7432235.1 hypothetical protein [Myxococcota bacterium]